MNSSFLALAALTKASNVVPAQLPLSDTDRRLLADAMASPILQAAADLVLPGKRAAAPLQTKTQLQTAIQLFSELSGSTTPQVPLPPGALSLELAVTSSTSATPAGQLTGSLDDDLAKLANRSPMLPREVADLLLGLLQRHAWNALNGTGHFPEVPLADFARLHAATAACMASFDEIAETPFALIGADISGIQAFIYDIASRKAARALKGRSFYLHLLAENFVTALLDRLGLSRAHVIYASGGGAYVLAPNTPELAQTLTALRQDLSERLFTEAGTRLFLALDCVTFGPDKLFGNELAKQWGELSEKLSQQKRRRFAEKLVRDATAFFTPQEMGGVEPQDAVTGDELRDVDKDPVTKKWIDFAPDDNDEPGTGLLISRFTQQHIRLGSTLRAARRVVTVSEAQRHILTLRADKIYQPGELPYWNVLPGEHGEYARTPAMRNDRLNEPDFLSLPGATGFQLYGGNDYPRDEAEPEAPKTYDLLAGTGSFRRLGILRMDVDSLGKQFIQGFADGTRSLAHYVTLSRSLDWFFKGYLNTLWRSDALFRDNLSIVYSGGDDLFVVGRWDAAIRFGEAIASKFAAYTGGALTLSGGVAIVPPRFPISRAARLAEKEEDRAKGHEIKRTDGTVVASKNAFSFLGTAVHWQYEWPVVQDLQTRLVDLLGANQLPRSVLRQIYEFAELQTAGSLKWRWQMAYDFSRSRERLKGKPDDAQAWMEAIERAAITNEYSLQGKPYKPARFLSLLTLAARWAELTLRSSDQK